jgi:hypothetical protein
LDIVDRAGKSNINTGNVGKKSGVNSIKLGSDVMNICSQTIYICYKGLVEDSEVGEKSVIDIIEVAVSSCEIVGNSVNAMRKSAVKSINLRNERRVHLNKVVTGDLKIGNCTCEAVID